MLENKKSVVSKFKGDLGDLAKTLAASSRHYVRCIKPNDTKAALDFESVKVMTQLACNGVFESVALRKAGFSNRLEFAHFINAYFACMGKYSRDKEGITAFLSEFLEGMVNAEGGSLFAIGHTKVFLRDEAMDKLAAKQKEMWERYVVILQSYIRSAKAQKELERLKELDRAAKLIQKHVRVYRAVQQLEVYRQEYILKMKRISVLQCYMRRAIAISDKNRRQRRYDAAAAIQKHVRVYLAVIEMADLHANYEKHMEELRLERERLAREEAERIERERIEAEQRAKEEEERRIREEEERIRREEEERIERERLAKEEEERRIREEEERIRREEEERLERERLAKLAEEERIRLEAERAQREEEERLEAERLAEEQRLEQARLEREEADRLKREEEERKLQELKEKLERERLEKEAEAQRLRDEEEKALRAYQEELDRKKREKEEQEERIRLLQEEKKRLVDPALARARRQEERRAKKRNSAVRTEKKAPSMDIRPADEVAPPTVAAPAPVPVAEAPAPAAVPVPVVAVAPAGASVAPVTSRGSGLPIPQLALDEAQVRGVREFFDALGLPLADSFIAEAIDVDTMLIWTDPKQELLEMGVTQKGVIARIINALAKRKAEPPSSSGGGFFSSLFSSPTPSSSPAKPVSTRPTKPVAAPVPQAATKAAVPVTATPSRPVIPDGPKVSFKLSLLRARISTSNSYKSWGGYLTGSYDVYARAFSCSPDGVTQLVAVRTEVETSSTPVWIKDGQAFTGDVTIPQGWQLILELVDTGRAGDTLIGRTMISYAEASHLASGPRWFSVRSPPPKMSFVGEIQVAINGSEYVQGPLTWSVDPILGDDFHTLPMRLHADLDGEPAPVCTITRRLSELEGADVAVLYVHSFGDFFWNEELADCFSEEGYNFYAIDLRRCGRSMANTPHPGYVRSIEAHYEELHKAFRVVRDIEGHDKVLLMGTGAGGLLSLLFANDHPAVGPNALLLNSPFLTLPHNFEVSKPWFGGSDPFLSASNVLAPYLSSLHKSARGEWDFNLSLRPLSGAPLYSVYVDALEAAIGRISSDQDDQKISIKIPTLVVAGARGYAKAPSSYDPGFQKSDVFLDIASLVKIAPRLGSSVKLALIRDAIHDVFASGPDPRESAFDKAAEHFAFLSG
eukprot:TRINITY_DN3957_c0_g1_i1.p1 TRINITY_DN3957_c0_g1~~TRINITY_DN3957_c0_g1_i1.p1  ORF type:complete len:1145 (-),score=296.70 TRINITY_DN3957_c0_g1_i1:92-3526(-)